jgi:hypothetical protein
MLPGARRLAALASAVLLFGFGAATTVGQVRARRRARELQDRTLPLVHGMEGHITTGELTGQRLARPDESDALGVSEGS